MGGSSGGLDMGPAGSKAIPESKRRTSMKLANVVSEIPISKIHKYDGIPGAIYLTIGQSDYMVSEDAVSRITVEQLRNGSYIPCKGLPKFREAVAYKTQPKYDPETEVLPTVGVQQGIDLALRTLLNPGDIVAIPFPAYISYEPCARLVGASVFRIRLPDSDYHLYPEDVDKAALAGAKVLIMNYPHNPTGTTMSRRRLEEIADVVINRDLFVISDEIYSELYYTGRHFSIANLNGVKDRVLVLNGMSKAYAMAGYRLGYACGPKEVIDGMTKLNAYLTLCTARISQEIAIHAIYQGDNQIRTMLSDYRDRRDYAVKTLNAMGLPTRTPKAAIYMWADIRSTGMTSDQFVDRLIKEHNVVVVPGTAFGPEGEGFIRISISSSMNNLRIGLNAIESMIGVGK